MATLTLWVRSYWIGDEVARLANRHGQYFSLSRGRYTYFASETPVARETPQWAHRHYDDPHALDRSDDAVEGRIAARAGSRGFRLWQFAVRRTAAGALLVKLPLWLPALLLAIVPTLWILRRRNHPPSGSCAHCGYDLRATPDRCPECGRATTTTTTA